MTGRIVRIVEVDDPRVADFATLRDSELRKRYEARTGVFIAEGPNVVRQLIDSDHPVVSLLCDPRRADAFAALVPDGTEVFCAERDLLYEIVAFPAHQGVLGCGRRLAPRSADVVAAGARRVLVLDAMNDHENMGALFRTARALGADGVLLGPRSADPLYRRCVRVSMGHVLHVPHATLPELSEGGLELLSAAGLTTVALTPDPAAAPIDAIDRTRPLALLLGPEGPGLAPSIIAAADVSARIPMATGVDSLNVTASAAIALHALRADTT